MTLYRVHRLLYVGSGQYLKRGQFTNLAWLNEAQRQRLVAGGAVSEVVPPPLRVLTSWKVRAEKLQQEMGIITVTQFLAADTAAVAAVMNVKERTVEKWKQEAQKFLVVEDAGPKG